MQLRLAARPAAARALVLASALLKPPVSVFEPDVNWATGVWTLPIPNDPATHGALANLLPYASVQSLQVGLPNLPTGLCIRLEERDVDEEGGFGGTVWRAAGAMCRWQLSSINEILGARILELGAGTGAAGLFAAALGARQVVLSDGEANLLPLLDRNVELNAGSFPGDIYVGLWRFGELPQFAMPEGLEGDGNYFELAIGSDITYSVKYDRDGLSKTLQQLLRSGTAKRCVIAHEHRRSNMFDLPTIARNQLPSSWDENDDALQIFLASAAEHDLRVTPIVTEWGWRAKGDGSVFLTTDLSIFEVTFVGTT